MTHPRQVGPSPGFRFLLAVVFLCVFSAFAVQLLSVLEKPANPLPGPMPAISAATPNNVQAEAAELVQSQKRGEGTSGDEEYLFRVYRLLSSEEALVEWGTKSGDKSFQNFRMRLLHPFFKELGRCIKDQPLIFTMRKKAHITGDEALKSDWLDLQCVQIPPLSLDPF